MLDKVKNVKNVNCDNADEYNKARGELFKSNYTFQNFLQGYNFNWDFLNSIANMLTPGADNCKKAKEQLISTTYVKQFEDSMANINKVVSENLQATGEDYKVQTLLTEALRKRLADLDKALNASAAAQITENLPLILGVIGAASVLTIAAILLFKEEVQMERVASGQVIQFITVMILLSVITALALSNKIQENTLGTLLGGIAGYVLAQGVGRAAARAEAVKRDRPDPPPKPDSPPKSAGDKAAV